MVFSLSWPDLTSRHVFAWDMPRRPKNFGKSWIPDCNCCCWVMLLTEVFKRIFGGSTTANRFAHMHGYAQIIPLTILSRIRIYDTYTHIIYVYCLRKCVQRGFVYYVLRDAWQNIFFAFLDISATNLPRDRVNAAASSQDKDESGFASIDELDPKSAKATWAHDLIVGREDCGVGNPRFEFPFEAVDGDNPGKSFGVSWGGIVHQTRGRFLC